MEKEVISNLPEMKINEEGDEIVVQIHISGVDEKDIELEVREDFLKVNISKESGKTIKKEGYEGAEWQSKSFDGMVSLPSKVVPMLIHHSYNGKILEVKLKKQK